LKKLSRQGDMSDHVPEFGTLFAKLENAGFMIEMLMQVSVLLASLDTHAKYESTIAAIRTLADDDITWEIVTTRLREEYKQKQMQQHVQTYRSSNSATVAYAKDSKKTTCSKWRKVGHTTIQCWYNPDSPNYRGDKSFIGKKKNTKWQNKNLSPLLPALQSYCIRSSSRKGCFHNR
jgi:gag-polypeptide of LTR copia-type